MVLIHFPLKSGAGPLVPEYIVVYARRDSTARVDLPR